jgi:hypothetical protein
MRLHQERGELGMRVIIAALALVAGVVWVVPMVFLGKAEVDNAAVLTGAAAQQQDAAASPASSPQDLMADPIGNAKNVQAQISVQAAMQAAQMYFAQSGSYEGFGPTNATEFDPSIKLTTGPATTGVISVRNAGPTTIVLVIEGDGGGYLCAGANGGTVSYGRTDAQTAAECSGGW